MEWWSYLVILGINIWCLPNGISLPIKPSTHGSAEHTVLENNANTCGEWHKPHKLFSLSLIKHTFAIIGCHKRIQCPLWGLEQMISRGPFQLQPLWFSENLLPRAEQSEKPQPSLLKDGCHFRDHGKPSVLLPLPPGNILSAGSDAYIESGAGGGTNMSLTCHHTPFTRQFLQGHISDH